MKQFLLFLASLAIAVGNVVESNSPTALIVPSVGELLNVFGSDSGLNMFYTVLNTKIIYFLYTFRNCS